MSRPKSHARGVAHIKHTQRHFNRFWSPTCGLARSCTLHRRFEIRYAYLNYLFETLPNLDSRDDATLEALLPWNVKLP